MEREKTEKMMGKQPYETPQLTTHGSIEQVTGQVAPSGLESDGSTIPE
jgi:hypothetical protein